MKCLGVDLGDVRTGLAISDSRGIVATGLESYNCKGAEEDLQHIVDAIVNNNIECCVIGYPINMNGTFGPRAEKSQNFKEVLDAKLKELNIDCKVVLQDERLSTVSSQKVLIESGVRREKRKNFVDKIAATIILQSFLDTKF